MSAHSRESSPASSAAPSGDGDDDERFSSRSSSSESGSGDEGTVTGSAPNKALKEFRIPRKPASGSSDRGGLEKATSLIPPPPSFVAKRCRAKVELGEESKQLFTEFAAGVHMPDVQRPGFFESLPLVDALGATTPHLDPQLRSKHPSSVMVREGWLINQSDLHVNALAMLSIAHQLALQPTDGADIRGYIAVAMRLIATGLHDVSVVRRERALRSHHVHPHSAIPSFESLPLPQEATTLPKSRETVQVLFGSELLAELTGSSSNSDVQKALSKLAESQPRHQNASRQRGGALKRPRSRSPINENRSVHSFESFAISAPSKRACLGNFSEIKSEKAANRLENLIQNWKIISNDPWLLDSIRGYRIDFLSEPPRQHFPPSDRVSQTANAR
jgi:hypothetical protein